MLKNLAKNENKALFNFTFKTHFLADSGYPKILFRMHVPIVLHYYCTRYFAVELGAKSPVVEKSKRYCDLYYSNII